MQVSTALRRARERRGWTQRELARRLGYTDKMVSAIETGERTLAPDVALRGITLLDDPEFAMTQAEQAAGGVMVAVVLDGPRVDLHRMSTGRKAIEEFSEAIRAIAQCRPLINCRGPEDLGPEDRRSALEVCRQTLQAGTAAINTVRIVCQTYCFSPVEISLEHVRHLESRGYIEPRQEARRCA